MLSCSSGRTDEYYSIQADIVISVIIFCEVITLSVGQKVLFYIWPTLVVVCVHFIIIIF